MQTVGSNVKTWWLTGLPGAGKTTLANAYAQYLRGLGVAVCVLDGDELRKGLSKDLGFSPQDREEQSRRTAEMAYILNQNNIHAIVALISPTASSRKMAKSIVGEACFVEAYIATPLAVCRQRDPKGWYAKAKDNPKLLLTGVNANYEEPLAADVRLDTSMMSIEEAMQALHLIFSYPN